MRNLMSLSIQTSLIVLARDSMLSVTWATCDRPHYLQCALVLSGAYASKSAKKFFCWLGWGVRGMVGRYLTSASSLHFILEATA